MIRVFGVLAVCIAMCTFNAQAGVIASFATGVNNGSPVLDGQSDPNFNLVSTPGCGAPPCSVAAAYVANQTAVDPWFYSGSNGWQADSSTSKWISPAANVAQNFPLGYYQYRYMLDLTGLVTPADLNSLRLSIAWWTDNNSDFVQVNGTNVSTGSAPKCDGTNPGPCFAGVSHFVIPPGAVQFNTGQNTIIFDVYNGDALGSSGPTGFRLEAAVDLVVPEPGTVGVGAAGLLSLLALARRRKSEY